jgi:outer membrane protein OmpA-like peptidoglycan-associated protein
MVTTNSCETVAISLGFLNLLSKKVEIVRRFILGLFAAVFCQYGFTQVLNRSGEDSTIFISHDVFLPNYIYSTGSEPWDLDAADLDGDGDMDVALVARMQDAVFLHLNDGKGEFQTNRSFKTLDKPRGIVIADFDLDGDKDIAVLSSLNNRVVIHYQTGKLYFQMTEPVQLKGFATDLAKMDLNGDGHDDLIVTCNNADQLALLIWNQASRNFAPPQYIATIPKPRSLYVHDMNQDGKEDILVGGDQYQIAIHYNESRVFTEMRRLSAPDAVWSLCAADFDKDGDADLAIATYHQGSICIYYNKGVQFDGPHCIRSGDYNFAIRAADLDKDGDIDLVTASSRDGAINVHLNDGKGKFSEKQTFKSGNYNTAMVVTDVDKDLDLDILTVSANDHNLNVHRNIPVNLPEVKKVKLHGYVKDSLRNIPLKGVVELYIRTQSEWISFAAKMSNQQGYYEFEVPYGHQYQLQARVPEYPTKKVELTVPKESEASQREKSIRKDILLIRIDSAFVMGVVKDKKTGEIIPGAIIEFQTVRFESLKKTQSDTKGEFKETLPLGENHLLIVTAPGYQKQIEHFSLREQHYTKGLNLTVYLDKEPPKKQCVEGFVFNANTKAKIPNASIEFSNTDNRPVEIVKTNSQGYYKICLPPGKYYLTGNAKGFVFSEDSVEIENQTVNKDLYLSPIEVDQAYVLRNIYFDYDKATLRPESKVELDRLVKILKENPTMVIEIGGHTDSDGSEEYNLRLSQARAESVMKYLIQAGIEPERLRAKGYGETQPVAPNDTPENKQKNRRTEFKVLKY